MTEVNGGKLLRHAAQKLPYRPVCQDYVVATSHGFPRCWRVCLDAAIQGYKRGLTLSKHNGMLALCEGVEHARVAMKAASNARIDVHAYNASLIGISVEDNQVHCVQVGQGRVYLCKRNEVPDRLTTRITDGQGLLRGEPLLCSKAVKEGDMLVCGTETAFTQRSVAKFVQATSNDPKVPPRTLTQLLIQPAALSGQGAAAVVLRMG